MLSVQRRLFPERLDSERVSMGISQSNAVESGGPLEVGRRASHNSRPARRSWPLSLTLGVWTSLQVTSLSCQAPNSAVCRERQDALPVLWQCATLCRQRIGALNSDHELFSAGCFASTTPVLCRCSILASSSCGRWILISGARLLPWQPLHGMHSQCEGRATGARGRGCPPALTRRRA